MIFTLRWMPVSSGLYCKLSPNDTGGGGGATSFGAFIYCGDREYLQATGYIEKLSPYNNSFQNKRIREYNTSRAVVEHDTPVTEFPVPKKTQFILDALNRHEDFLNNLPDKPL